MQIDRQAREALVTAVRRVAQAEIMPRFRNLAPSDIATKTSDQDFVTIADTRAEAALTIAAREILPGAVVIGEESVAADATLLDNIASADLAVILDPVDGTWNYRHGLATFGVILAVLHRGEPIFGLLYDPAIDDHIEASKGEGAWYCRGDLRRRLFIEAPTSMSKMNAILPIRSFPTRHQAELGRLSRSFGQISALRCSCHEYRMLATGQSDFRISPSVQPWDHAAGVLIHSEAGGVSAYFDGTPYSVERNDSPLINAPSTQALDHLISAFSFLEKP